MNQTERLATARELYEERAAIREFDGGQPRDEAQRAAKLETEAWLKAHRPDDEVQP